MQQFGFLLAVVLIFSQASGSVAFAQFDKARMDESGPYDKIASSAEAEMPLPPAAAAPSSPTAVQIHWFERAMKFFAHANTPAPNPCSIAQPAAPVPASAPQKVSCIQPADTRAKPRFSGTDDFIDYMAALALPITHQSHFPVSVLIAQALLESGGGKTDGYLKRNSFFGLSCFARGETIDYAITVKGAPIEAQGRCSAPRPASERGYYVVFNRPVDSVVAYIYTLLQSPRTSFYATIRRKIENLTNPDAVLSHQEALAAMSKYNPNPKKYRTLLEGIIQKYQLDRFDHAEPCL